MTRAYAGAGVMVADVALAQEPRDRLGGRVRSDGHHGGPGMRR
jgi:hypothetical protein